MSNSVYGTSFWCDHCGTETLHMVHYVHGRYLKAIVCTACHRTTRPDPGSLRSHYSSDLPKRFRHFLQRNLTFAYSHPRRFVTDLPRNLILKSLAISSELYSLLEE